MTKRTAPGDPEPIDAEFEPADGPTPDRTRAKAGPRPLRGRAATVTQLAVASVLSAVLGAGVAIIVASSDSAAPTGTLAHEIDELRQALAQLTGRADQAAGDAAALRTQVEAHEERLDQAEATYAQHRLDLAALTSQLAAISGVGAGTTPAGAAPANSPLGVLLARINRLEAIVADDRTAPETTREVQRAIADLSSQVSALDLANTTLVTAFDRREAALAALEAGLQSLSSDVAAMRGEATAPIVAAAVAIEAPASPQQAVMDATQRSQTIRALAALEAAARQDRPFLDEHAALSNLLPGDALLASLAEAARAGAPTLAQLRADFDRLSDRARRIATTESDDGWNVLREAFSSVVEFRPSDLVARNDSTLRTARRALDTGDVRGAVTAVSGLQGQAGGAFDTWRSQALARARLDEMMKALNLRLLGAAAAAPGPG